MLAQRRHIDPAQAAHRFGAGEQHVVHESQRRHRAAPQAFFRHKMQTCRAALVRTAAANGPALQGDGGSIRAPVFARKRLQQFALTVARYTRQPQNFARAHLQRNLLQIHPKGIARRQTQAMHAQYHVASPMRALRQHRRFGANHHAAQRGVAFVARIAIAAHAPRTQHRAAVAKCPDFMQFVADIKNAAPLVGQLAQHAEKALHRLRRQHRGGFIENQQARVGQQRADDFHPLHFTHAQGVHQPPRVDRQMIGCGLVRHHLRHLRQRMACLQTQPDVLRHGERLKQAEMLEHHGDAQRPRLLRA